MCPVFDKVTHHKQKVLIDLRKLILKKLRLDVFSHSGTCEGESPEWHTKHRTRATAELRFRAYRIIYLKPAEP